MIILYDQTLQEQFTAFCNKNNPKDLFQAIEYFSVFGGLDIKIDMEKPLQQLIEESILNQYNELKGDVHSFSGGYRVNHAILSAAALGDRRTNSSFKKAFVSFEEGMKCVERLCEEGIIELESSLHFLTDRRNDSSVAKKILFATPFFRFWFAFVSPIYKGIKENNYEEFNTLYNNNKDEFIKHTFEELCLEYIIAYFGSEEIVKIGKYWDNETEIDLLAKTKSGKIIAANCRYINSKIKKSELNKLKDDCVKVNIKADTLVLFSKNGFTNELKSLKSDELKLFNAKSLKLLINE